MKESEVKGFTLVEVMIVVAIIGIIASIVIPNFIRAKTLAAKTSCIGNMKQIQNAVQVWVLDTMAASNATPTTADLVPYYIKTWPKCGTATYAIPAASDNPICPNVSSNPEHHL